MVSVSYPEAKASVLLGGGKSCSPQQLVSLMMKYNIEARPAEKIDNLEALVEELEERLVLEPDLSNRPENLTVLHDIAVDLNVDCPDLTAAVAVIRKDMKAAEEAAAAAIPFAGLALQGQGTVMPYSGQQQQQGVPSRLLVALAETFCRLPEGDLRKFLRYLGIDFEQEIRDKVVLRFYQVDSWFNETRDRRLILRWGCECFLENVRQTGAYDFDLTEHVVDIVGNSNYFDPPLRQLVNLLGRQS